MNIHHQKENLIKNVEAAVIILTVAVAVVFGLKLIGLDEIGVIVNTVAIMAVVWYTNSFIVGIFSAVIAMGVFNYLFIDPVYTFAVSDGTYLVMLITMTLVALATSIVAKRAERDAQLAMEKEEETKVLFLLNNKLADADSITSIVDISLEAICEGLWCDAWCFIFDENGEAEENCRCISYPTGKKETQPAPADVEMIRKRLEGIQKGHCSGEDFWDWPLYGGEQILGAIRIDSRTAETFDESNRSLLLAMIESTSMALRRFREEQQNIKSIAAVARERYRANLLRAISHDIRTPLTGIIGTSEMLIDSLDENEGRSLEYARSIQDSARWLHSLVENILNLTRLEDDEFKLKKSPEALEEVVAVAIGHVLDQNPLRDIEAEIPDEFIMVGMDAKLIEQVIINLISNAIKHSDDSSQIIVEIYSDKSERQVWCSVKDEGEGLDPLMIENIFKSFYTGDDQPRTRRRNQKDGARSFGLGLAICETIIEAHGGKIMARNRADVTGAEFLFSLPMDD